MTAHGPKTPWSSLAALCVANAVPIVGVTFLGWRIGDVMIIYWFESVIIGVFNIQRMRLAQQPRANPQSADGIGDFIFMYGNYLVAHGFFVFGLFVFSEPDGSGQTVDVLLGVGSGFNVAIVWAVLGLIVSHAVSHRINYIGRKEYQHLSIDDLIYQPFPRVVAMHATLFLGGLLVVYTESASAFLGTFVVIKIIFDVFAHLREHAKFRAKAQTNDAREPV
jgi:hypothetical protein